MSCKHENLKADNVMMNKRVNNIQKSISSCIYCTSNHRDQEAQLVEVCALRGYFQIHACLLAYHSVKVNTVKTPMTQYK